MAAALPLPTLPLARCSGPKVLLCGALLDAWVGCAHTHAHVRHAYVLWISYVFCMFFSASHMFYVCFFSIPYLFCMFSFSDFIHFLYIFLQLIYFFGNPYVFSVIPYVLSVIPYFFVIHMFL